MWKKVKAQTLYANRKYIKYFLVSTDEHTDISTEKETLIQHTVSAANKQDKVRFLERQQVMNDEGGKDTPWLNRTGWKQRFIGEDMKALVQMTSSTISDEEQWLKDVESLVTKLVEHAYTGISRPKVLM
jgi:hypothetical protein